MRRPFQIGGRKGWHGEYKFADGTVRRATRATEAEVTQWLEDQKKLDAEEQGPLFGGPTRLTLGRFLGEYAARYSIAKKGYKSEIDRINHYVTAAGLPRLKVVIEDNGNRSLVTDLAGSAVPRAFRAHMDKRMAQRTKTYACIRKLANKPVSKVSTADIRELMTLGTTEGWGDSTIQKEVALLKSAFNSAIREWPITSTRCNMSLTASCWATMVSALAGSCPVWPRPTNLHRCASCASSNLRCQTNCSPNCRWPSSSSQRQTLSQRCSSIRKSRP